jgi:hypothetical protein
VKTVLLVPTPLPIPTTRVTAALPTAVLTAATADIVGTEVLMSTRLQAITEAVKPARLVAINLQIHIIRVTAGQAILALTAVTAGIATTVLPI